MKDWEDVIKGRLAVRKAELPESDWNDFLSRKAGHERAAQRRRRLVFAGISVPAAAAILLLLFLAPFKRVDDNNISAVVAKVQSASDTAKFDMAAYKLPEGTSVEELIRNLPGVRIDSAGGITVNGKSVSRILVNGKEFFSDDKSKSLTQLTAEMIEKVKAYDARSSANKNTLVILDGDTIDVAEDKLADFDFETTDKKEIASLVGIGARKIVSAVLSDGVYEVQTRKYSRKAGRAGK